MVIRQDRVAIVFDKRYDVFEVFPIRISRMIRVINYRVFPSYFYYNDRDEMNIRRVPFTYMQTLLRLFYIDVFLLRIRMTRKNFRPVFKDHFRGT